VPEGKQGEAGTGIAIPNTRPSSGITNHDLDTASSERPIPVATRWRIALHVLSAHFNNQMGTTRYRADFPNPDRLLRHGQTGTVLINRTLKDAIVIPERATYKTMDKR
jgi:hypothetical protein